MCTSVFPRLQHHVVQPPLKRWDPNFPYKVKDCKNWQGRYILKHSYFQMQRPGRVNDLLWQFLGARAILEHRAPSSWPGLETLTSKQEGSSPSSGKLCEPCLAAAKVWSKALISLLCLNSPTVAMTKIRIFPFPNNFSFSSTFLPTDEHYKLTNSSSSLGNSGDGNGNVLLIPLPPPILLPGSAPQNLQTLMSRLKLNKLPLKYFCTL